MKQTRETYKIPTITSQEKKKRKIRDFFLFLFPFFLLFLVVKVFFIIGIVPSSSMFPLMNTDSGIIANRLSYASSTPQRGDVIVFKKEDAVMTKRIIGVPGDRISIQNGLVYINEQPVVENYVSDEVTTEPLLGINHYEVPERSYFVLGDNRANSNDSRNWKNPFVPSDDIMAKVLCVFSINPFSHGFYYRGVSAIHIEETYSNVPPYDASNIITETSSAPEDSPEEKKDISNRSDSDVHTSTTLPVFIIAPESISETETEVTTETENSDGEHPPSEENSEESEPEGNTEEGIQ